MESPRRSRFIPAGLPALSAFTPLRTPSDPDPTRAYNNLGIIYGHQGKYDEAIAQYERALRIKENAFGVDHIDTADTILNMGLFYKSQGQMQLAKEYLSRAHSSFQSNPGTTHPSTQKGKVLLADLSKIKVENTSIQKQNWRSKLRKLFK